MEKIMSPPVSPSSQGSPAKGPTTDGGEGDEGGPPPAGRFVFVTVCLAVLVAVFPGNLRVLVQDPSLWAASVWYSEYAVTK